MSHSHETESDSFEGPLTPTRIGLGAGAVDVVGITAFGHFAFDSIALGAVAGLLLGAGVALFFPVFIAAGEDGDLESMAPGDDASLRGFHRLAAGFALSAAGMVTLLSGFVELEPVVGLSAALLAGGVVYLGAGFVLPNATLRP